MPGIGPKTAGSLIQEYHTLENIYDHIDEVSGAVQKKLLDGKDSGIHSKRLVELMNVDVLDTLCLDDYKISPDIPLYRQILVNNFQFDSMAKILDSLKNKYAAPTQESLW